MKKLISFFSTYYISHPFRTIFIVALIVRLIAVIFSKGYAMMDDHYLIIEQPQQWVDHYDENKWLPQYGAVTPSGHSMFYIGIHYCILWTLQMIGIMDAQIKMYIIRFLHALWSMGIIYWGYLIVKKLSNPTYAKTTAWILSLIWLFPFLSVHQLVEFVSIPFFLWSIWLIIKEEEENQSWYSVLIAGFVGALSVSVRFQTSLIIMGIVLSFIIQKKWKIAIYYSMGVLFSFILIQGLIDFIIWKRPFAEFAEYVR
ncbi:MAG: glycosyltransferase family 39 protein, partial [Bacteroidales bacterium]